jgi:hypothetical protein
MSVKMFVIIAATVAALAGGAFCLHHPAGVSFMHSMRGVLHGGAH